MPARYHDDKVGIGLNGSELPPERCHRGSKHPGKKGKTQSTMDVKAAAKARRFSDTPTTNAVVKQRLFSERSAFFMGGI